MPIEIYFRCDQQNFTRITKPNILFNRVEERTETKRLSKITAFAITQRQQQQFGIQMQMQENKMLKNVLRMFRIRY